MKLFEYRATLAYHLIVAADNEQQAQEQIEQLDGFGHRWAEVGEYFEVVGKELFDTRNPDPSDELENEADIICEPMGSTP